MRSLSAEEAELWAKVTATIRPLSRVPIKTQVAEPAKKPAPAGQAVRSSIPVRKPPPSGIGTTLDSSWDRRLRSGSVEPDRTLDLHGMNLDTAWQAIDRTLEQSIRFGDRVVLLITGHHRRGDPPVERGRIRAAVYDWLHASRHASRIAAVRGAHRRHGGGGSLYIILRR